MSVNFVTASLAYLKNDGFDVDPNFSMDVSDELEKQEFYWEEQLNDIALRDSVEPHLIPIMRTFFSERFVTHYLDQIFNLERFENENRDKLPSFIFVETGRQEMYQLTVNDHTFWVGDINYFHQEVSALGNALGLVLTERDNYPGGKQKTAFKLIDMSWSALSSKLPLVFY